VWNKRENESEAPRRPMQPEPMPAYAPPPEAPRPAPRNEPARPPANTAAIGASMYIRGDIRTGEELLVDGEVEGTLQSDSLLTVGPNGKVQANVKARELVVYGSLRGNAEVAGKIAIRLQGSLIGDIKAAGISIDDGAYFKGSIDIVRPEPKMASKPVKTEPAVAHAAAPIA